jgi:hypothetical protein
VAIEDGRVSVLDLTGVVEIDDLGNQHFSVLCGVVLGVRADVTSLDILDRQIFDVETNVVTGGGLFDLFVIHLN